MLRRSTRRVGSLLAAAAAFSGVSGFAALCSGQELAPASQELTSPSAVIARAAALADEGRLVHAYETLGTLLAGSGVRLTDEERAEAMGLSSSINRRIAQLDSAEVSLQRAEYALGSDDLRTAAHHAGAVSRSPTATPEQSARADRLLGRVEARRAEIAPAMRERLADALDMMEAGEYAEAKRGLDAVSRAGVDLGARERERLMAAQEQILLLEVSRGERFGGPVASAGVMQPGVVTREEEGDGAPAGGQDGAPPPEPMSGANQPEQEGEQDFLQIARQLEKGSTMAEADVAFEEGRWAEARSKYRRALSEFGDLLGAEERSRAERRAAEAEVNLGSGQPDLLGQVRETRDIAADQHRAEFRHRVEQARSSWASGNVEAAREQVAQAQLVWASAKNNQLFAESELASLASQLDNLRGDIALAAERIRREEIAAQEEASASAAIDAALRRERERARKITEAIDRARALQSELKYNEALEVVENQILFLDPINPSGLLLRDLYRDILIYRQAADSQERRNTNIATLGMQNREANVPPTNIVDYPPDWPAISALRAGSEATYESPADRRVLSSLESKTMPANFNNNTIASALEYIATVSELDFDVDWQSLEEIGIDRESTVSLSLRNATAKTVLDRVLEKVSTDPITQADWAVRDGIVQVANEDRLRRHVVLESYDVRDLVFEIPDYDEAPEIDLQTVLQSSQGGGGGQSPFQDNQDEDREMIPLEERIERIREIIYTNVDPASWPEGGGTTGSMFELNGLLLVNQTPKNHRQIRSLLAKLRESKAMQINVESRFLLVAQDFFERVGFDLDIYFNAQNNQIRAARATDPTIMPRDFFDFAEGNGLRRSVSGPGVTGDGSDPGPQGVIPPTRWSPIGTAQNSFGLTSSLLPVSDEWGGQILASAPALGVAGQFLDDVQVDFLIEATQADRRSVQLTAPRLTFTNGQTSNIYVATQQSFVSDLQPITSDSAVGFDPTLAVVTEGVVMIVQGQVTADRRYVLLNVDTSVAEIEGFATQPVTAVAGGQLVNSADTQSFIQLPTLSVTRVQTTVTVPDQGTVLLGGQRLISEFEVETGVPVLSKIPVISRFFTNRVESREEQTLLILIKPTILIQNEQEEQFYPGLNQMLGF
jgi:type II secretory pathway component GspD/PulD (secretin)